MKNGAGATRNAHEMRSPVGRSARSGGARWPAGRVSVFAERPGVETQRVISHHSDIHSDIISHHSDTHSDITSFDHDLD